MQFVPHAGPARRPQIVPWLLALALFGGAGARADDGAAASPDPLAQAVLDSLAFPPRTAPEDLLDAAIRATDVEAYDVASRYFARLVEQL
ncbi:MAG: hypothetical protein ACKO6B_02625 [Planctomycetia bacterium]